LLDSLLQEKIAKKTASIHTATTAVNEDLHATKKRDKLIKLTA